MASSVPRNLTNLVSSLDIIFSFITILSIYLPSFNRSWTYQKGIITRRDVWIAKFVMAATIYRQLGAIFSIVNLARDIARYTLALRVILNVVLFPVEARMFYLACKTWRRTRHRQADQEELHEQVPQQPGPREGISKPIPRGQLVLYVSDLDVEPINRHKSGWRVLFWATCGVDITFALPTAIFISGVASSSVGLSKTSKSQHPAAILIYVFPIISVLLDFYHRKYQSSQRGIKPKMSETLRFSKAWLAGTVPGLLIYIIVVALNWDTRREHITDMKEFWIQLGEALGGSGG